MGVKFPSIFAGSGVLLGKLVAFVDIERIDTNVTGEGSDAFHAHSQAVETQYGRYR
jgi:hypothetical protein